MQLSEERTPRRSVGALEERHGVGPAHVALGLAALVAVLDGTVVAVALDPLARAFGAPLTTIVWVTVAYLLAAATMLPLLGWATTRFGGRRVFLTGLVLFLVGSGMCALAWSAPSLIGFRVLQGFGGGLLEPSALTLVAGITGKEQMGRVMGTLSMIVNLAPVGGPIVGGALLSTGHWQWIFVANVPLGLGVLAAALAFVPGDGGRSGAEPGRRADVRGLALLTVGFVSVLFALNRSGQPGRWWVVAVPAGCGLVLLAGYARHALTATGIPAFDLRLLRRPGFAPSLAVMALVALTMYSQLTALPIFDAGRRLHGFAAGLLVCALGLGLLVSMSAGGRLSDRTGPRPLVRVGALVTAVALAAFAYWHGSLSVAALFALFVAVGLSFGLTASPTFAGVYRTLEPREEAAGTTALFMTLQLAASLGVTVLGVLQARAGAAWTTALFAILAGAQLAVAGLSGLLPGRPGGPAR